MAESRKAKRDVKTRGRLPLSPEQATRAALWS